MSTTLDRYEAGNWINKGNVHFLNNELTRAQDSYEEALRFDPENVEALYNQGSHTPGYPVQI